MKLLIAIFLSSFLLFQVQPILAKMALPLFGGGGAIWTACMLFFQLFLLLGYLYSHCLSKLTNLNHQVLIHSVLIGASLLLLPITPFASNLSLGWQAPQFEIMFFLLLGIGFPYFILSSTAPLIQKWYSVIPQNNTPYRLYSLSNLGSLLALLSYPLLIEPAMTTQLQTKIWSVGYGVFALLMLFTAYRLFGKHVEQAKPEDISAATSAATKTGFGTLLLWLLFSATSVILMVSTTNAMTQNIPPTPFLWILPLCIYLLTYIICFNNDKWYVRRYWLLCFGCCSLAAILMFYTGSQFNIVAQVVVYAMILFFACMLCHGELARLKPDPNKLTLFYLIIAVGGLMGSIFTSIVAERIFTQYYEFPVGIALVYLLFIVTLRKEKADNVLVEAPLKQNYYLTLAGIAGLVVFGLYFLQLNDLYYKNDVHNSRNFYGTLSVKDLSNSGEPTRVLFDGATSHGTQSLSPASKNTPTSYYRFNTGVALALQHGGADKPKKVAIIGLGTGTLASYGQSADDYVFYELNPNVARAANDYFSYLADSKANVTVRLGDARVTLQNELQQLGSQQYQVMVVDAFSSDSIPVHLLTLEAFQLYWQHLTEQGMLVLHITNTHLDLLPLVATLAESSGKKMFHFYSASDDDAKHTAEWVVVTNNDDFINNKDILYKATYFTLKKEQSILWTEEYSNLMSVIKF